MTTTEGDTTTGTTPPGKARRRVPRRRVVGAIAGIAGLVLGGVIGFAAGWLIQRDRAEDDISHVRPVGTVQSVEGETLLVRIQGEDREYRLSDDAVVENAESGSVSDIDTGAVVLVRERRADDGTLEAREVIVLPDTSTWSD